jgi:tripartite-type tricarboxylate transporter receptor subunit TctC
MSGGVSTVSGKLRRGAVGVTIIVTACTLAWVPIVRAADAGPYPNHAIRIVVPFATGTQLDIAARLVGSKLAVAVAQPVVIENHPGASGNIGSEVVARAPPDGYTLLMTGSLITLLPTTMGARAVDPVAALAPIIKLAEPPIVIVANPSLGVSTLPQLIAVARREPGRIAYATAGIGTVQHLTASIISNKAGIEMLHVPYANAGQALNDVLQGQTPVYFAFLGPIDAQLKGGQLRALAVASNHRISAWPDIPSVSELGFPEAATQPWNGVLAPAGTPAEIIELLYREFARIVQQPDVRERFARMGMEPLATPPDRFGAEIREAVKRWPAIAAAAGVQAEQAVERK